MAKDLLYAVVGAGDFAVEKMRAVASMGDRKATEDLYNSFVERGRKLSVRIRNSVPTKEAVAQTKVARSQVKAAATSVSKAVRADARAARSAAQRAAKAS